jgi:hypothetical protein
MLRDYVQTTGLSACILLSACAGKEAATRQPGSPKPSQTDSVRQTEITTWSPIIASDNLKVEGNSNIDASMIQSVMVRFEPYVWFEDFPANSLDTTTEMPPNFSSNKEAKHYITAIRDGYAEGNSIFGGHYELIMWGCGAPCAGGVIVDRKTGSIYDLPFSTTGYEFRYNSLLLIVNPTDEDGFYPLIGSETAVAPELYRFNERAKRFDPLPRKGRT